MHVHASTLDFVKFLAFLLIAGLLLRYSAVQLAKSDNPYLRALGEGLSFIY